MDEPTARLTQQLMIEEGVRPKIYLDTKGIPTAGVGRNMRDVGLRPDEVAYLLANDIAASRQFLTQHMPWYGDLDPVRQAAIIDMSFMGVERLLGFINMLHYLSIGDYENSAEQAIASKWFNDVGPVRGNRVADMLRTGAWPADIPFTGEDNEHPHPSASPEPGSGSV